MKINCVVHIMLFVLGMVTLTAEASKLRPEGTFIERKLATRSLPFWERKVSDFALRGIHQIGEAVHEEITNRILGCNGDQDVCGDPDYNPENAFVLAGVRWNDDPPFRFEKGNGEFSGCEAGSTIRLVTFPLCWANVFKDGETQARNGKMLNSKTAPMLTRSHFGDLQYLHSMASQDNVEPVIIRNQILAWAEFSWRIAMGEFPIGTTVKDVPIPGVAEGFSTKGWSIQDLFALGNPHVRSPVVMSKLAYGTLLHVIEDSFAEGHVERASSTDGVETCAGTTAKHLSPARIIEFHSYGKQDAGKHGSADSRLAFSTAWAAQRPNVIDIGRELNEYYLRRAPWTEVKPFIECIFALHPDARKSSAGSRYAAR
jgi:hypothetical protein